MYYAYVLVNPKGILYKGSTDNLEKRVDQHNNNSGFPSFTTKRGPWKLVYFEEFDVRKDAESREKYFKSGKGREFIISKIKNKLSRGSSVS